MPFLNNKYKLYIDNLNDYIFILFKLSRPYNSEIMLSYTMNYP